MGTFLGGDGLWARARGGGGLAGAVGTPAPGAALVPSWHRPPGPVLASDWPGWRRAAVSDLVTDFTAGGP